MNRQNVESVTIWLNQFKEGQTDAVQPLWNAYFTKMVTLARTKLGTAPRVALDEEDVVASAFFSFCEGVKDGRFPKLDSRDDLWSILFTIVVAKSASHARFEGRQKRGSGKVIHASSTEGDNSAADLLADLASLEPTADEAAIMVEDLKALLDGLGDSILQKVAIWKMDGYTNREIANLLNKSEPTIERKLKIIRETWKRTKASD